MRCGAIDVVIERLKRICGQGHVVTDRDHLRTYESDGLRHYRSHPPVAVLPGTAEEVRDVVRASYEVRCRTLQINAHLREQGHPLPSYHPIELVDRSIRGARSR